MPGESGRDINETMVRHTPVRPGPIEPTSPFRSRGAALVAGYLLWVSLFFVLEGAGRKHCHVPSRTWVEAGADAHERALRGFRYDKSEECLATTAWYAYPMGLMFLVSLLAPFVVVGLFAKKILHAGLRFPIDNITATAVLYGLVFCLAVAVAMAPYEAARWFYDRYGVGGAPLDE